MTVFIAVLVTLVYIVISTVVMYKFKKKIEELAPQGWGAETPAALTARRNQRIAELGLFIMALLALDLTLDNWQTTVTLMLLAVVFPIFAKSFSKGAIALLFVFFAIMIIWQLPSSGRREETIVDEAVKVATPSTLYGHVDAMIIEDRGQYLVLIEDENGCVKQAVIPADITNGHYINDAAMPVVIYHYRDSYKRTFWSGQRTKFVGRKLDSVDLYVKRGQLLNTF